MRLVIRVTKYLILQKVRPNTLLRDKDRDTLVGRWKEYQERNRNQPKECIHTTSHEKTDELSLEDIWTLVEGRRGRRGQETGRLRSTRSEGSENPDEGIDLLWS